MSEEFSKILHPRYKGLVDIIVENRNVQSFWDSGGLSRAAWCGRTRKSFPTYFRYIRALIDAGLLRQEHSKGCYRVNEDILQRYVRMTREDEYFK